MKNVMNQETKKNDTTIYGTGVQVDMYTGFISYTQKRSRCVYKWESVCT